jgi:hypothetical protein
MEIGEAGSFLDAQTFEPVALEGIRVLGQVIEEREYLTSNQLYERRVEQHQPFFPDVEGIARLITVGMAQVKAEEEEQNAANDNIDVLTTCTAMIDSGGYQLARDRFRSGDADDTSTSVFCVRNSLGQGYWSAGAPPADLQPVANPAE